MGSPHRQAHQSALMHNKYHSLPKSIHTMTNTNFFGIVFHFNRGLSVTHNTTNNADKAPTRRSIQVPAVPSTHPHHNTTQQQEQKIQPERLVPPTSLNIVFIISNGAAFLLSPLEGKVTYVSLLSFFVFQQVFPLGFLCNLPYYFI